MSSMPRNHHIQALRGIGASLVVLDHAFGPLIEHGILPRWFDPVRFSIGGLGVYTFFVISGFIMINMSYDDFGHVGKSISFAERRIVRIVPTYWIGTLLAFALYEMLPLSRHPSLLNLFESLTFIPYSIDHTADMEPVLGQGWTLNYEMFFYALFTVALTVPRRIGLPGLFLAFAGIVAGGSCIKSFSDVSPETSATAFLSNPLILLFAAGMAIGVLKRKFPGKFYVKYPFQIALALITAEITVIVIFRIPPRVPFPAAIMTWIPGITAVAVCALTIPPSSRSRVAILSETLGDASYSMYIFHIFFLFGLTKILSISPILALPFVVTALVGSMVIGILFFRIVERPISGFCRAMLAKISLASRWPVVAEESV
jgi:exopolysaccharide production protein ExoZ